MIRTRFALCRLAVVVLSTMGGAARGQTSAPGPADVPSLADPLAAVNVLQGTDNTREFSHGNALPLVGPPWAMTDWCVQNHGGMDERWFYQAGRRRFYGFRATHSPCPWAGDYGHFDVCPQVGPADATGANRPTEYDPAEAVMRPDYVRVKLPAIRVTAELTSSERAADLRLQFAPADHVGRLRFDFQGDAQLQAQGNRVWGYSKYHGGPAAGDFRCFFAAELDRPVTGSKPVGTADAAGKGAGYVEFEVDRPTVDLRIATSYISPEQARRNLDVETRGGFDAVRQRTAAAWQQRLSRIQIDGTAEQRATFYSCLFRTMKYPHRLYELDAAGRPVHYSPWDGHVHDGVAYTDSGLWDTYRTQFPLLSIVAPEQLGEIVDGWLNAYGEAGWLPQWPNPGGIRGMPGSHADAMIADAMCKGIGGFDYDRAYAALRHDAFDVPPPKSPGGRSGMRNYLALGYLPAKFNEYWVTNSLDYAYDDWCVAQAAKIMHHPDDYRALMARSQNYRKLWDPGVGFMRGKAADGKWADPTFDEFAWGGGYAESGPWQASMGVQHDPAGLADLAGGPAAFAAKLDRLFAQPPTFHPGSYGQTIHEMSEFAACKMGQFEANNQPGFHLPYLYAAVGQPWKTEYWTRRACGELFHAGPDGYPGDDDNGSTSAWYVLSSIGLYPLTPGQPTYVLTSPAFRSVTIALPNGKTFKVEAADNAPTNVYVHDRTLDGRPDSNTWIGQAQITAGGTLVDHMADRPAERVVSPAELPYSAKTEMAVTGR